MKIALKFRAMRSGNRRPLATPYVRFQSISYSLDYRNFGGPRGAIGTGAAAARCDALRQASDARLFLCLGQDDAADLAGVLRATNDDTALEHSILAAIARTQQGNGFADALHRPDPADELRRCLRICE